MSSPSKDSEQFGENDGSELSATLSQQSQSLLQPGGTLLGKDMPDATKVDLVEMARHIYDALVGDVETARPMGELMDEYEEELRAR